MLYAHLDNKLIVAGQDWQGLKTAIAWTLCLHGVVPITVDDQYDDAGNCTDVVMVDGHRVGVIAAPLDRAWEHVNALGGTTDDSNPTDIGWGMAIDAALHAIESLGGMDPRARRYRSG